MRGKLPAAENGRRPALGGRLVHVLERDVLNGQLHAERVHQLLELLRAAGGGGFSGRDVLDRQLHTQTERICQLELLCTTECAEELGQQSSAGEWRRAQPV